MIDCTAELIAVSNADTDDNVEFDGLLDKNVNRRIEWLENELVKLKNGELEYLGDKVELELEHQIEYELNQLINHSDQSIDDIDIDQLIDID